MFSKESLGINDADFIYYELDTDQKVLEETIKTYNFFTRDFPNYLKQNYPKYYTKNIKIKFINWGHMEVVYVLDNGKNKYTLLMGQPNLEFGKVKKEYDNLKILSQAQDKDNNIVNPLLYYANHNNHREVYMTPYYYQARCISYLDNELGIYVPEPNYHFEKFNSNQKEIIEKAITAKILSLYNLDTKIGLADFTVSSGDFILEKGFNDNIDNIFNKMKIIAARNLVNMPLDDYIALIYQNLKLFKTKNIDKGIELGISKIKKRT